MLLSVIVPVGDEKPWKDCRSSIEASISRYGGDVRFEVVPCMDLGRRGVSVARNEGLSRAAGNWIAWVDSDDEVTVEWAESIAENLVSIDAAADGEDVLSFGAELHRSGGGAGRIVRYAGHRATVAADRFLKDCLADVGGSTWLWNKVFRRSLFSGLRFEGATQEDFRIMPRVMAGARKVRAIPDVLYRYNRPEKSLTHGGGGDLNAKGIADAISDGLCGVANAAAIMSAWKEGCAIRAADCIYHSGANAALLSFLRKNLWRILVDPRQGARAKAKAVAAALGVSRRGV